MADVAAGPDPMGVVDMPPEVRARDGGRDLADRTVARLVGRAAACRALARLGDNTAHLLPRLFEADRRRASLGTSK
jgi:hypothetical protein